MIGINKTLLLTVPLTLGIFLVLECEGSSYPGVSVFLSHRDRKMNMQYFNDLRRDVRAADMNELMWDLTMAKESRRIGRSCDFESTPDSRYSSALYKQLFDPTARPGEIIMNAIRFWASQKSNFTRFGWQSCEAKNTCEYIKMVTASLNNAACSLTRCSSMRNQRQDEEANMYFVVCLFSPTTVTTRPPYSKGRKCSRCPLYSSCRRGLCSSNGRRFLNTRKPSSRDRNRIIKPSKDEKSSLDKGRILQGYRYLDSKGNIRIRQSPRYLAQKGRRPSYINRPTSRRRNRYDPRTQYNTGTRTSQQRAAPTTSRRRPAPTTSRRRQVQAARVKRQTGRNDYRYQLLLRRREEQRRREEERERREREHRRQLLAQQLRQRAAAIRKSEDEDRREEQRKRLEELRRQREEERLQAELERRREEERRRRERQRELERRRQQRRRDRYAPAAIESPMNSSDKFRITQVHNSLRGTGLAELNWSNHLERWARYVIRCDIEYPGPIDTFTNFGKIDKSSLTYNIIYDWGAEGNDVYQRQTSGCRTPDDRERCNHNVIVRNPFIRNFACASLDCVDKTQLTCIYK